MEQAKRLIDRWGRQINYVRLSVTDRCDFRCHYCMAEEMTFLPREQVLSLEEIALLAEVLVELGVTKLRITGGEPLVRRNLGWLLQRLGQLKALGLRELVLTTNGSQLARMAAELKEAGVDRLNISLDTLDPVAFRRLTRKGDLSQVLAGLEVARQQGFKRIKLNTVVQQGVNEQQILPLVAFARQQGFDISFIEEMPLGQMQSSYSRSQHFFDSDQVLQLLNQHYALQPSPYRSGGPARYYSFADSASLVGLISPYSHNFCADCNRVRVTAEGQLVLCLGNEQALDLRGTLRAYPGDKAALKQRLLQAMQIKPERHNFSHTDEVQVVRFMNMTGG
ncbi:GTP 3',8-cyclase MoaA [Balneatrix alpica]|uniref:GTP 3',8-cyclase MoaA n=1 Tax=Balneatrix alpica TaxID=75684 RepID=UPI0027397B0A|nr:GTP 3',8-cyclase MoaA [Balneatrix alpica]